MSESSAREWFSWKILIYIMIGLVKIPTKVNCWYCNENSYLTHNTTGTKEDWKCSYCENHNVFDEQGEIVDTFVEMYDPSLNNPVVPHHHLNPIIKTPYKLCNTCARNQAWICDKVREFIKEPTDPDYKRSLEEADIYKAALVKKYKLCKDCQLAATHALDEQRKMMRRWWLGVLHKRLPNYRFAIKPTTRTYLQRGALWMILHVWTILLCCFAYSTTSRPEAQGTIRERVLSDLADCKDILLDGLQSITYVWYQSWEVSGNCLLDVLKWVTDEVVLSIRFGTRVLACVASLDDNNKENCAWPSEIPFMFYTIGCVLSFWIFWHPWVSRLRYQYDFRLKNWKFYKNTQVFIHLCRFGMLFLARYATNESFRLVMKVARIFIPCLLAISVFSVKILPVGGWPSKKLGFIQTMGNKFITESLDDEPEVEIQKTSIKNTLVVSSPSVNYEPMDIDDMEERYEAEERMRQGKAQDDETLAHGVKFGLFLE
ncbi:Ima1 N-terminal domain-containing protein [Phycomyces nitens]|nr:Ima1 N-terminal domain-containing protein [Phycomyces nitens]